MLANRLSFFRHKLADPSGKPFCLEFSFEACDFPVRNICLVESDEIWTFVLYMFPLEGGDSASVHRMVDSAWSGGEI